MKGGGPLPGAAATPGPISPRQPPGTLPPTCLHCAASPPASCLPRHPGLLSSLHGPPFPALFPPAGYPLPGFPYGLVAARLRFLQQTTSSLHPQCHPLTATSYPARLSRSTSITVEWVTMSHFSAVVHCHLHYGGGRLPSATRLQAHQHTSSSCTFPLTGSSLQLPWGESLGRRWCRVE